MYLYYVHLYYLHNKLKVYVSRSWRINSLGMLLCKPTANFQTATYLGNFASVVQEGGDCVPAILFLSLCSCFINGV